VALKFHQVQEGDTLSEIAARFGLDSRKLARLNRISNPDLIRPGEVIMVPTETSPEDRMRIEGAKQTEQFQRAQAERPSRTGPQAPRIDSGGIAFEIDMSGRRAQPTSLPANARGLVEPPQVQGTGSLENVRAKSYPPNTPEQMLYPEFWMDFLNQALPTAVQGATGPGAGLMRAVAGMRRLDNPFQPEQLNPARADFMRRAGRHFERNPNEPMDPNYGQVFEQRLPEPRPDPREIKDWNWYRRYPTDEAAPPPFPRKSAAEEGPFSGWRDFDWQRWFADQFGVGTGTPTGKPYPGEADVPREFVSRARPTQQRGQPESSVSWDDLMWVFRQLARG